MRSALSTAHGPAIMARLPPPISTPLTSTILGWGCASQRLGAQLVLVADDADDGTKGAAAQVGFQPQILDPPNDVVNLLVGGAGLQDDNHAGIPLENRRGYA
jgi:hypothetical protein